MERATGTRPGAAPEARFIDKPGAGVHPETKRWWLGRATQGPLTTLLGNMGVVAPRGNGSPYIYSRSPSRPA